MSSCRDNPKKWCLKRAYLTISIVSLCALVLSTVIQFKGHLKPCSLCWAQRVVYLSAALISAWGFSGSKKRLCLRVLVVVLLCGLGIASYQSLMDFGFISSKCYFSPNDLLDLVDTPNVSETMTPCTQHQLMLFGVPASFVNALIFLSSLLALSKVRTPKQFQ